MKIRVGSINFLNCLPITYSFLKCGYDNDLDLRFDVPSKLNNMLKNSELDISPISSIAFAKSDNLALLGDIGIIANGEVKSIILVSKVPIENLNQKRIILTSQSETSHCLLKIILKKYYQYEIDYKIEKVNPHQILTDNCEAALLIGDDALFANYHRLDNLYYYDLGKLWKKFTNKCMVYAVWAVNYKFYQDHINETKKVYHKIKEAILNGKNNRNKVLLINNKKDIINDKQLNEYLDIIHYDLLDEEIDGLKTFYDLAVECGFLTKIPHLS